MSKSYEAYISDPKSRNTHVSKLVERIAELEKILSDAPTVKHLAGLEKQMAELKERFSCEHGILFSNDTGYDCPKCEVEDKAMFEAMKKAGVKGEMTLLKEENVKLKAEVAKLEKDCIRPCTLGSETESAFMAGRMLACEVRAELKDWKAGARVEAHEADNQRAINKKLRAVVDELTMINCHDAHITLEGRAVKTIHILSALEKGGK